MNGNKHKINLGIVGVRGYVGRELVRLLADDEQINLAWISSRQLEGHSLSSLLDNDVRFKNTTIPDDHYFHQLCIECLSEVEVANRTTEIIVLALPNGLAKSFVSELEQSGKKRIIIDLSADYRFDPNWDYSVPELFTKAGLKLKFDNSNLLKISNPGCYATAMQVALAPLIGRIVDVANCFGISGYSGAGTKPSTNNNPENLKDNILPYGLIEHLHEKEVAYQLGIPIHFSPHVAQFFRGISMTVQIDLSEVQTLKQISDLFTEFYAGDTKIVAQNPVPNIQQVVNTENCIVGGFSLSADGKRLTLVSCLDNLLKGAASQALDNIKIALHQW